MTVVTPARFRHDRDQDDVERLVAAWWSLDLPLTAL